ncbi:MAG: hypothetical protein AVDCRST_MAG53-288, partial [uncultured Solirubrobacteraceae bacterium]
GLHNGLRGPHPGGADVRRPLRTRTAGALRRGGTRTGSGARRDQAAHGSRARRGLRLDRGVDHLGGHRERRVPGRHERPGTLQPDELPASDRRGNRARRGSPPAPGAHDVGVGGRDHRRSRSAVCARADDDRRAAAAQRGV